MPPAGGFFTPIESYSMSELSKDEAKAAVKEALHEWLEEKYALFGRWSFHGLLAIALAGLAYLALVGNGWHKL